MIARQQVFDIAGMLPGAVLDRPFTDDFDSTVLRHGTSGKWFGLVMKAPCRSLGLDWQGETDVLNLKCDPLVSYGLFQSYPAVVPAYHMNKTHWISVILALDLPMETLEMLIRMSFDLTATKPRRRS